MGSSSTKRKSSSVNKKRSKKNSSQVRKRKRNQSKSRKEKSRKVLRRKDPDSYSDSDSMSLSTSFSSDDSYSRKRSRSCTSKDGKGSRKRARSPSSGTSSDSSHVKKRKSSKRKADVGSRKKSYKKKKKSRKDLSPSSVSQSSCSCSRCWGGTSNSSESEYEKTRGRSQKKERYKEDTKKDKSDTRQTRLRSQSSSAHSRHSEDSGYYRNEKSIGEYYPKRLRSVITVVKVPEQDEVSEAEKDQKTEYLVYDHDDYPSDRSNGSSEAALTVKDVNAKDAFISNDRTFMMLGNDDEDRYDGQATWNDVMENNQVTEKEGEVSANTVNPETEDLESILRQRALENLLKFRGGIQKRAGQEEKSVSNAQQTSRRKPVSTQISSDKEGGNEVTTDTQAIDQTIPPAVSPNHVQIGEDTDARELGSTRSGADDLVRTEDHKEAGAQSVLSTQTKLTSLGNDSTGAGNDSTPAVEKVTSEPVHLASTGNPKEKAKESTGVKPCASSSKREPIGMLSTVKQILTSNASLNSKALMAERELDKSTVETGPVTLQSGNKIDEGDLSSAADSVASHPSSPKPASAEASSGDLNGETKDSSQYEQKTMSVMRGGEMVQVNYKVYIPKKAPALSRRQLKR